MKYPGQVDIRFLGKGFNLKKTIVSFYRFFLICLNITITCLRLVRLYSNSKQGIIPTCKFKTFLNHITEFILLNYKVV